MPSTVQHPSSRGISCLEQGSEVFTVLCTCSRTEQVLDPSGRVCQAGVLGNSVRRQTFGLGLAWGGEHRHPKQLQPTRHSQKPSGEISTGIGLRV